MDDDDIEVAQARRGAGLPHELAPTIRIVDGGKRFDGYEPVETRIERLINHPHAAFPDLLENPVMF